MNNKRIILVGPAGSGKDYFRDYLLEQGFKCDVSYTTRPMRTGEKEAITYIYVGKETFNCLDFYEKVEFNGWLYGTSQESWDSNQIFIMTPSGIRHVKENDRKDCIIVYFNIPLENRRERLEKRSDADNTERRLKADEEDFKDFVDFDIEVTDPFYKPKEVLTKII